MERKQQTKFRWVSVLNMTFSPRWLALYGAYLKINELEVDFLPRIDYFSSLNGRIRASWKHSSSTFFHNIYMASNHTFRSKNSQISSKVHKMQVNGSQHWKILLYFILVIYESCPWALSSARISSFLLLFAVHPTANLYSLPFFYSMLLCHRTKNILQFTQFNKQWTVKLLFG